MRMANDLSHRFSNRRFIMFMAAIILMTIIWNMPLESFGIEGLTVVHRRVISIFAFATIMWITECIPSWATSVSLIGLLLFSVSDNTLLFLREGIEKEEFLSHKAIMATFADPIIILFLGGFVLAIAATKSGLDAVLARTLLRPFGHRSEVVLLGFLLITGSSPTPPQPP